MKSELRNKPLTICNIYGPNIDKPAFFSNIEEKLSELSEKRILIGDFNVALDEKLDRYNSTRNDKSKGIPNKKNARRVLNSIIKNYQLTDIWRDRNENKLYYSWSKRCPGSNCKSNRLCLDI